jgi:hypothetical protein
MEGSGTGSDGDGSGLSGKSFLELVGIFSDDVALTFDGVFTCSDSCGIASTVKSSIRIFFLSGKRVSFNVFESSLEVSTIASSVQSGSTVNKLLLSE